MPADKVLITGTGRCGTTFLMRLLTLMHEHTGYTPDTLGAHVFENCNSGLELPVDNDATIVKSPRFCFEIGEIATSADFNLKFVIAPVRDLHECVQSRVRHGFSCGGFWDAHDAVTQHDQHVRAIAALRESCTEHRVPLLWLDFERMIVDAPYLFTQLQLVFAWHDDQATRQRFARAYQTATNLSAPKTM